MNLGRIPFCLTFRGASHDFRLRLRFNSRPVDVSLTCLSTRAGLVIRRQQQLLQSARESELAGLLGGLLGETSLWNSGSSLHDKVEGLLKKRVRRTRPDSSNVQRLRQFQRPDNCTVLHNFNMATSRDAEEEVPLLTSDSTTECESPYSFHLEVS